jgi:hypothetical protein
MKLNQLRVSLALFPHIAKTTIGSGFRSLREAAWQEKGLFRCETPIPTYGEPIPAFDESERDYDDQAHGIPDPEDIQHRSIPQVTFWFVLILIGLFLFCGMFPTHERDAQTVCDAPSCRFMAERQGAR